MSKEALKLAMSWIHANGEHDQLCDILDLDDDGKHKPCSCGLSRVQASLREALAEQPAYRAVKTFHGGKAVYVAEQPAQQEPVAWLYTLEYGHHVANTLVSEVQRNYPFGVCGADYRAKNEDGISYVRQTPLHTADQLAAAVLRAREACAKLCEENNTAMADTLAREIRARGQA